jgi:hypothetical protein
MGVGLMKALLLLPFLLALTACNNDGVPSGDAAKDVHPETYSVQVRGERLIDKDLKIHWLQEYLAAYAEPTENKRPAAIKTLEKTANCRPPGPRAGSVLAQVLVDHGTRSSPLYAMSSSEVDQMTKTFMSVIRSSRDPDIMLTKTDGMLTAINVIVTETSRPVHLVLAARSATLWNIQKADKAVISGVTLISGAEAAAIANIDPKVPVVALTGAAAKTCGALPAVRPVMEYPGLKMQIFKANHPEKELAKMQTAYQAYNGFFTSAFGQSSTDVSVGAQAIDHAAIGPTPATLEERVPFKGYENTTVYITPAALVTFGTQKEFAAAKRELAIATASRMTGGDYAQIMESAGY